MSKSGKVIAVCISEKKGTQKKDVGEVRLIEDYGIEKDAHAGPGHRQVSLLALESADTMRAKGLDIDSGDFGENIVTEGVCLKDLSLGTRLRIGKESLLEITQIGKECHDRCAIY
ncbi:MAG: MOSC domain-containing protein, partial [Candidatus Brocadiales bacterium]